MVIRIDLSRKMVDVLLHDIDTAWDELAKEQPVQRARVTADLWTAPEAAAGDGKLRSTARR